MSFIGFMKPPAPGWPTTCRERRIEMGLNLEDVARAVEASTQASCSVSKLSRFERGEGSLDYEEFLAVCSYLAISLAVPGEALDPDPASEDDEEDVQGPPLPPGPDEE